MESVITDQNRLIIGGDFNIHMEDKENASVEELTDMLDSMNMQNHANIPTHVSGHVLDLLITRNSEQLFIGQPERRYFISDHAFIRFKTIMEKPEVQIKHISYRRLNDIDLELFKKDLRESKIMENQNKSVHKKAMIYDQVLRELLDKHAPMKEKQIKVKQGSPWYDQNLKDLKKKKRAAEKVWLQSGDVDSFEKFKCFRYEYICSCNHAKCDFYSKEILKCDGNQKKLYNLISRLTAGDKLVPYPDCDNDENLSNMFGKYFIEKVDKIKNEIHSVVDKEQIEPSILYREESPSSDCALDNFRLLSCEDVNKLICGTSSKSCCLDAIPTYLLKQCMDVLLEPITDIVNGSLQTGAFPDCWKCGIITPVLKKKGSDLVCRNYRPLTNLSFLSKIVEKAGLSQYVDHLDSIDMFMSNNSAYKKHHSTETLLVKINSDIMNNMDQQTVTMLVLLDLSAAFDTVSLGILTEIFQFRFGIAGNVLKWFVSYLSDREQ